MRTGSPDTDLIGREAEVHQLGRLLDGTDPRGAAVVVRGEAGIGKTALLSGVRRIATAGGIRVLETVGVEAEAQLPFAGLHRLLRPVLDRADRLPAPQRRALLAAFGMRDGPAPDLFLIGLAAVDLVREAAANGRAVLLVDDSQWLDRPTADVLGFMARRLEPEPLVLIAALREGFPSVFADPAMAVLHLERLDDTAAAALLDEHAPRLAPALRERFLIEAAGNPLALRELPVPVEYGTVAAPPAWLPLTTRLEQAFAGRVSVLPTATRTLLLVAAVNDGEELPVTLAAAARMAGRPITLDDLTPALVARLVESDGRTARFRHPLMRTAIRQRSSLAQRHAVHAALADALVDEPDRRVWHRAAGCIGTDDEVATELEAVADRAQRRGAVATAVAALERAADLSTQPDRRSERLLRAAELAFELGGNQLVARLLDDARLDVPVQRQTQLTWIRDSFDEGLTNVAEGMRTLADAAERVAAEGNTDLAMKFLGGAALRGWWADQPASPGEHVAAVAERIDVDAGDPRLLFVLAFAAPLSRGAVVLGRLRRSAGGEARSAHECRLLGNAATAVGDFELASILLADSLADLRVQGRLGLLARALTLQSWSAAQIADLSLAGPVAAEAARLAYETSQPVVHATARATQALVAALCGEDVEHFALQAEQVARPVGANAVLAAVQIARGAAALGHGRHAAAWDHLRRLHDPVDPAHHGTIRAFALGDLAEAAVHSGHVADARALMVELEELGLRTPSPALHVGLRHARALLADDADADRRYEEARAGELRRWPFAQARVQLAHGAWLRRQRRVAESRPLLRSAAETFDALGTVPWGDRARQELRASGERSRRRTGAAQHQLTPQELQIVQLAAAGLTNREIGEQLYLSHRTVSSHLHRIFPKLGVTSRAMLGDALSGSVTPGEGPEERLPTTVI